MYLKSILRGCLGIVLALPLMAQHGRYLRESQNEAIGDPQAIAAGAKLYSTSCAGCHGPDGSGGGRGPNLVQRSLWHPLGDEAIFNVIRKGVRGADMPPTDLSDEDTWKLVAFLHALIGPAAENSAPGDPEAGREIFWSAKGGCSSCHSIRGKGGHTAPDLTNVGGSRPLAVIKKSIVEPAKDLYLLGLEAVVIQLKNGQVIRGVARNRNNYSLQVVDANGDLHLLSMLDVAELKIYETSQMPGDYAKRLSAQELENLLAYLAQQTLRPVQPRAPREEK
jgi:putative heme-binding domain-containing protein